MSIDLSKYTSIGFTGTRRGMTNIQDRTIALAIDTVFFKNKIGWGTKDIKIHHGDCVGSDARFHRIVVTAGLGRCIVIHPPENQKHRAFCNNDKNPREGIVLEERPYIVRDDDIIDASGVMLATPGEEFETRRSGTWTTIRHARKKGKKIFVILPSGTITS